MKKAILNSILYLLIGSIVTLAIMAAMVGEADKGILDLF